MPPGAILDLDDPYVGIETHFARETLLDLGLGGRQFTKASDEQPVCGTCIVEDALRRWSEQLGGPVKPVELDEYGSGLLGATVKVTLEIEAEIPSGAPDHVVRTVTENSRTLKFTSQGFERE